MNDQDLHHSWLVVTKDDKYSIWVVTGKCSFLQRASLRYPVWQLLVEITRYQTGTLTLINIPAPTSRVWRCEICHDWSCHFRTKLPPQPHNWRPHIYDIWIGQVADCHCIVCCAGDGSSWGADCSCWMKIGASQYWHDPAQAGGGGGDHNGRGDKAVSEFKFQYCCLGWAAAAGSQQTNHDILAHCSTVRAPHGSLAPTTRPTFTPHIHT